MKKNPDVNDAYMVCICKLCDCACVFIHSNSGTLGHILRKQYVTHTIIPYTQIYTYLFIYFFISLTHTPTPSEIDIVCHLIFFLVVRVPCLQHNFSFFHPRKNSTWISHQIDELTSHNIDGFWKEKVWIETNWFFLLRTTTKTAKRRKKIFVFWKKKK